MLTNDEVLTDTCDEDFVRDGVLTPSFGRKKRKSRAKTPIVDDEVRRSARFREGTTVHIQLDNEPRKKKGEAKKSVSFSTVEDLKSAIINRSLDSDLEAEDIEPIQAITLVELGSSFYGIPPEELSIAMLNPAPEE